MIPATKEELKLLTEDFYRLRSLGNTEMKAAYLAAANQGFTEVVEGRGDNIKLMRESDKKFIVCSYEAGRDIKKMVRIHTGRVVKFHIDETILKNGGKKEYDETEKIPADENKS